MYDKTLVTLVISHHARNVVYILAFTTEDSITEKTALLTFWTVVFSRDSVWL